MDFRDISYVLAIAKHQNMTKAANELYISQPTLTKFLQNLESSLDLKLFKKQGNKFIPTYAGTRYIAKATEILQLKKELDFEMADIIKSTVGVLNIAFPTMRGTYMLPCTLPVFEKFYPNVHVNVLESSSTKLESMIMAGDTDIAFLNLPLRNSNIDYEVIKHEEIVLVAPKGYPLANMGEERLECNHPWIDIKKFTKERFILFRQDQRTRQIIDKVLLSENITPNRLFVTSNVQASVELVAKGYGITFVPETHLKHMKINSEVICFSIGSPRIAVNFVAAFRKGGYIPKYAQDYIKIVKQYT